jgi:hypothetical protein
MKRVQTFVLAAAWTASLFGVGLLAQGGRGANATQPQPAPNLLSGLQPLGPVITGENIGFQPVAGPTDREGRVPGYFVVKVNGQWVEVTSAMRIVR